MRGGMDNERSKYEEKRGKRITSRFQALQYARSSAGYFMDMRPNLCNTSENHLSFYVERVLLTVLQAYDYKWLSQVQAHPAWLQCLSFPYSALLLRRGREGVDEQMC